MAASTRAAPLAHRYKKHGVLSPQEWAQILVEESRAMGIKMTPKQIAEGVGVIQAESSGNASNLVQGPAGHIGAWSEEPSYGSEKERLDPRASTRAAIKNWAENGKSWWPAWGRWEAEQSGQSGTTQWKKYVGLVERALGAPTSGRPPLPSNQAPGESSPQPSSGGLGGDLMHVGLVGVLVLGGAGMIG